jgi:excisionase family DNA binding protein
LADKQIADRAFFSVLRFLNSEQRTAKIVSAGYARELSKKTPIICSFACGIARDRWSLLSMRAKRTKSPPKKLARTPAQTVAVVRASAATADDLSAPLLRVSEVARALKVSERSIYTYVDKGLLERVKIGAQTMRITSESLKRLMTPA